jgi:hypothetical protein
MILRKWIFVFLTFLLLFCIFKTNVNIIQASPIDSSLFDKVKINPCVILGTCPTSTPTIAPTNTPALEATESPFPPTNTPIPPTETPIPPTQTPIPPTITETIILPTITITLLPTQPGQTSSPTATLTPPTGKYLSQREIVFGGVVILLLLLLLRQSWPKIKIWLHDKTK